VVASPDTVIALPEVAMGLIPGAGGTISLPRRIGRHRTAYLALSGTRIVAELAQSWGLVDSVTAAD
jgi:enoyl-CoA hydratase/carnithine racemase